jgi:DNA-binding winged helix-turn-helix (wHTH) protein
LLWAVNKWPKLTIPFDVLLVLAERRAHLLEKNELMKAVWVSTFVDEVRQVLILRFFSLQPA